MTKNFQRSEFACKCGYNNVSPTLVEGLQKLRDAIDKPIHIISGVRCREHNRRAGGAPGSKHLYGQAADIYVRGMTPRQLYAEAIQIREFSGFGVNDQGNTLHVDVRPEPARWAYRDGRVVPWFDA